MKKLLAIFFCLFIFTGCATTEVKYVTRIQTNNVVLDPPKELYSNVSRVKPPKPTVYSKLSHDEKEETLFNHISSLNIQINKLILDRSAIDKWVNEQKKLYETELKEKR